MHDARQSTVGVEFSIETRGLIDKVLVGINYIVPTRLEKNTSLDSTRTAELRVLETYVKILWSSFFTVLHLSLINNLPQWTCKENSHHHLQMW